MTTYILIALLAILLAGAARFAWRYLKPLPDSAWLGEGNYAKVIADSITATGHRLTTMEVRFHRFVLAEFNTHSVFVRNSASSRAIPVKKMLAMVRTNPAMPLRWPSEQSGMQGGDELTEKQITRAERRWVALSRIAADFAEVLSKIGVHKSVTNRILEPFMWHTVVVTSSMWENFFDQRISPLAQAEIAEPARLMKRALTLSTPRELREGEAHLPYIDDQTLVEVEEFYGSSLETAGLMEVLMNISAARCARVSYLTQDGKRDLSADLTLYARLTGANPKHWSPLAHVALPCEDNVQATPLLALDTFGGKRFVQTRHLAKVGQFPGWVSMRHLVETEEGVVTAK